MIAVYRPLVCLTYTGHLLRNRDIYIRFLVSEYEPPKREGVYFFFFNKGIKPIAFFDFCTIDSNLQACYFLFIK